MKQLLPYNRVLQANVPMKHGERLYITGTIELVRVCQKAHIKEVLLAIKIFLRGVGLFRKWGRIRRSQVFGCKIVEGLSGSWSPSVSVFAS